LTQKPAAQSLSPLQEMRWHSPIEQKKLMAQSASLAHAGQMQ
jgi:hypothetical protein